MMTRMIDTAVKKPVVLCILDGWGHREESENNGIALARTPHWDRLWATRPRAFLNASERFVGLPSGQMGNSEVGHMNIGAGRIVHQILPRIDQAIDDGTLAASEPLAAFADRVKTAGGTVHLLGLISEGGVHSHQRHVAALAKILAAKGLKVLIHAFLDGRDVAPKSAETYLDRFLDLIDGDAEIATVSGRFFAMDRDKRWERVARAYEAIAHGEGLGAATAPQAVADAYAREETDEFVIPRVMDGYVGIHDGDGLLMANFRADRARELLTALVDPAFDGFDRGRLPALSDRLGMVPYSDALDAFMPALFPPLDLPNVLGEAIAKAGRKQLRIAETEKYAHVTFFLNGGRERPFDGEDRILVPSPKVATYDLQPEMSADLVTEHLERVIADGLYDVIIANYANPDMVGHSGILEAAIRAAEAVDACLGRLLDAVDKAGGAIIVTADHGNIELMADPETGGPHTAHTLNPVPVVIDGVEHAALTDGILADLAPTVLDLAGIEQPAEMDGRSLLVPEAAPRMRERRATA